MRLRSRIFIVAIVCLVACSDLGDPYVYKTDCDRSTGGMNFGNVALGHFSDRALIIGNSGNVNLEGHVTLSDSQFTVISGSGSFSIPPDGSIRVVMRYAPLDTGLDRAVADLGTGCPPVDLTGAALPPLEGPQCVLDPASLAFGNIKSMQTAERFFEVRNVGLIDFNVDVQLIDDGPFEITAGGGFATLDPGDTVRVTVKFAPTSPGSYNTRVQIGSTCDTLAVTAVATSPFTVSYATQIQPIYNNRCISCHSLNGNGGLDLRASVSHANTINVLSPVYGAIRVIPGDPDNSLLYGKITGNPEFGGLMPPTGGILNAVQRQLFRTWILEGAQNN